MLAHGVSAYALVNATVRAMYSTLINRQTWGSLVQSQDFDDILRHLSKTVYGPYLQIDRHLLTPRRVVYQIRWHLADVYAKLIRLTSDPGKQLLRQLWRHYEVDNLKATFRGIETGASWDQVLHLLYPMKEEVNFTIGDFERMLRTRDIVRAVRSLQHTPYYDTLSHALQRYRVESSLFPLEVALDLSYRRGLWESIHQLNGTDHDQALRTVGMALDIDNLMWAIRYREYHRLSEQEIINYTLSMGYWVCDEDIRAVVGGADIVAVVRQAFPKIEGLKGFSLESSADLGTLELLLQRYFIRVCRESLRGYPFHIGVPLAYLWLNEHEIRDLTVLVEAKASHMSREVFVPMLELWPLLVAID